MSEREPNFEPFSAEESSNSAEMAGENAIVLPEDREKKLNHDLLKIQLQYAQRLSEKKIPPPSESIDTGSMDFGQLLEGFTDLSTVIRDAYSKRTGKKLGAEENYQEFEKIRRMVVEKIADARNRDPDTWTAAVDNIISETVSQLPAGESLQETHPEELRAGVLRYSIGAGYGGLEKYGITPEDECVKTHLDPLFKQAGTAGEKKISELYKEAYAIIAKEVRENHPNAKALISESWLFDTNLSKKLGLHIYPSSNENMFRGRPFWGQFINRGGSINEERAKQFLETGKPPFKVKSMYIPIDEFMEKYGQK